jgi:hypothetical protein
LHFDKFQTFDEILKSRLKHSSWIETHHIESHWIIVVPLLVESIVKYCHNDAETSGDIIFAKIFNGKFPRITLGFQKINRVLGLFFKNRVYRNALGFPESHSVFKIKTEYSVYFSKTECTG